MYNKYAMTVRDLFSESFKAYNLTLHSGSQGLQNKISKVTVMEANDSPSYYTGGEFVISMLYSIKDDLGAQQKLISELAGKKVAALAIKINRYLNQIPDFIFTESEKYNLPVIVIPKDINYRDLIYDIYNYMLFNNKTYYNLKEFISGRLNPAVLKEHEIELDKVVIWLTEGAGIPFQYQIKPGYVMVKVENYLLGIINTGKELSRQEILRQIEQTLPEAGHSNVIISNLLQDLAEVGKCYKNLKAGFEVIRQLKGEMRFYFADEYDVEILLLNSTTGKNTNYLDLVAKYIKPLLEYDREYNNDLLKSLNCYYQFGNINDAAGFLNIHENTMRYRLKMINSVLGINTKNIRDNFRLFVALTYYNAYVYKRPKETAASRKLQ